MFTEGLEVMNEFEIGFNVLTEDKWPPVGVEFLWFCPVFGGFEVLNQPFFLKDISVEDVLSIDMEKKGGQFFCLEWKHIKKSSRSTVCFRLFEDVAIDVYLQKIKTMGGRVAALLKYDVYSLDLPWGFDMSIIDEMDDALGEAVEIIYPSYRFDD